MFSPTEGLNFTAAVGFLDAGYDDPPPFPIGDELQNAPSFTGNFGADYTFDIENIGSLTMRGDLTHKSTVYNNAENTELLVQDPVDLVNASITWTHKDDQFSITAGGTNLTNERELITGFFQPGVGYTEGVYNRETEWYLTGSFKY